MSPDPFGEDLGLFAQQHLAEMLETRALARGWEELEPDEEAKVDAAREDYHAFCEYVFLDDSGAPIVQQSFHRDLHRHLCTHLYSVVEMAVEHGKTTDIVRRCLWKLGKRPATTSIAIIMASAEGQSYKTLLDVKRNIENNARLHRVFPNLRRGDVWRQRVINVEGHTGRTPSVQALGIDGPINGDRCSDIEMDDLLNSQNSRSVSRCLVIQRFIENVVLFRTLDMGGREWDTSDFAPYGNVVLNGQAWESWDPVTHFRSNPEFSSFRVPSIAVTDVDEVRNPGPDTAAKIAWPERFSLERLQKTLRAVGEQAFRRMHLLLSRDPSKQRFRDEWIIKGLVLGSGLEFERRHTTTRSEKQACGLDLAHATKLSRRDVNVLFQLLWSGSKYRPLWIASDREREGGRWSPDEHTQLVSAFHERYPKTTFAVESNYGQQHFAEFVDSLTEAKVQPVFTGADKHDPKHGVEGIALMLERGKFLIPSGSGGEVITLQPANGESVEFEVHPEVAQLVLDMQTYDPDTHMGDVLAACWKAFALLGAVQGAGSMRGAVFGTAKNRNPALYQQF